MGGTNAVYILMSINLSEVGKCFLSSRSLLAPSASDFSLDCASNVSEAVWTPPAAAGDTVTPSVTHDHCDTDASWAERQPVRADPSKARRSVLEWATEIRRLRREWEHCGLPRQEAWRQRTWIVLHLFSGPRRDGDFGAWLEIF